jgi:Putative prokaryotic signal transducing protein
MSLVTILTSLNAIDAEMACSRLEAAGMHPEIINETAAMLTGVPLSSGGIRVQVPDSEEAAARELLNAPPVPPDTAGQ